MRTGVKYWQMPAPSKFDDLLRGPPDGVRVAAYIEMSAEFHWTLVEGYNEFVDACVLDGGFGTRDQALNSVRSALPEAVQMVPPSWKGDFPRGGWTVCHAEQVEQARTGPMRLDKACIVLLATNIACKRQTFTALHRLDVFKYVSLHPAIYKLVGTEPLYTLYTKFRGRLKRSERRLIERIKGLLLTSDPRHSPAATRERADSFLVQALEGRAMTWKNADLIASALNAAQRQSTRDAPGPDCLPNRITIEMMEDRSDGGKFTNDKHSSQNEAPFVSLSENKLYALRKDVEGSARCARR